MHEITIAQGLLEAILAEAAKQNAKPVAAKISCGAFDAINDEALCFAFDAVSKGTPCEGVKLQIEHKPMQGRCKKCNESFVFDQNSIKCPGCGSEDFELLSAASLLLEEIEFQTETQNES
jgi:hydrogenase nickel incorporation protein HypA/HybF